MATMSTQSASIVTINLPQARLKRGMVIAFLGPDGAGKSTIINGLRAALDRKGTINQYHHLRVRLKDGGPGRVVTDPHAQPPRGTIMSLAKIAVFLLQVWPAWVMRVLPAKRRGEWVILDRCFSDLLVDLRRYRYGGPLWMARLVDQLMPRPDLMLVLHASAEVIHPRKHEVDFKDLEIMLAGYRALAAQRPYARLVDVTPPAEQILAALLPQLGLEA